MSKYQSNQISSFSFSKKHNKCGTKQQKIEVHVWKNQKNIPSKSTLLHCLTIDKDGNWHNHYYCRYQLSKFHKEFVSNMKNQCFQVLRGKNIFLTDKKVICLTVQIHVHKQLIYCDTRQFLSYSFTASSPKQQNFIFEKKP